MWGRTPSQHRESTCGLFQQTIGRASYPCCPEAFAPEHQTFIPRCRITECYLNPIDLKSSRALYVRMPKRDSVLAAFGRNVRRFREARKMTQEVLAEKAELDRTFISDVERGGRNLSIQSIVRIANALGVSASELCLDIH